MKKRNRELRKQIREERGSGGQAVRKSGQMDTTFLVLVLVLVIFGLVMLSSASYAFAYYNYGNSFHFILRQGIFAVGGVTMMLAISKIDYHIYEKFSYILIGLSVVLLIVVLFMEPLNNARRWINLGFTTFQPSEVAKFAVIVLFAHLINVNYKRLQTFRYGVLPFMAVLAVICGLMVLEPHLSGTILIVTIGFTMMFVGGTGTKWFVMGGVAIVGALAFLLLFTPLLEHAIPRLEMWQNPFIDKQGDGWQTVQSLLAIGSGGDRKSVV